MAVTDGQEVRMEKCQRHEDNLDVSRTTHAYYTPQQGGLSMPRKANMNAAPMNRTFQDIFEQHFGDMQTQLDSMSLIAKSPPGTREAFMGRRTQEDCQPECPCCGELLTEGDEIFKEQGTITGCSHIMERFDALEYVYDRREAG